MPGPATRDDPPARTAGASRSTARRGPATRGGLILGAVIVLAVLATFRPALQADFVDWDDPENFLNNPHYRGLSGSHIRWMFTTFHMGHYQPLAWLTLGLDYQLWGMDPRGYHLTNNLLHALNALLVFMLARRLLTLADRQHLSAARGTPGPSPRGDLQTPSGTTRDVRAGAAHAREPSRLDGPMLLASALAALLFALHPLRVESVAWVTQRRDLLSATFYLLATLAWLRAVSEVPLTAGQTACQGAGSVAPTLTHPDVSPGFPARQRRRWLAAAFLLALACNLSKAIGVTLPLVWLVLDAYPLRRVNLANIAGSAAAWRRAIIEKLPVMILALVFAAWAAWGQASNRWLMSLERHPLPGRVAVMCYGLVFYLWKTLWPTDLTPIRELRLPVRPTDPQFLVPIILVLAAAAACLALRRRAPALVAAAGCYAIILLPVSGIVQNGWQLVYDRYSYLPSVGWCVLAGGWVRRHLAAGTAARRDAGEDGVAGAASRPGHPALRHAASVGIASLAVAVLALLATATWRQTRVWMSSEALWSHALRVDPLSWNAHNGYGQALWEKGDLVGAERHFRRSIELKPDNPSAHRNLWKTLLAGGRTEALAEACRHAIQLGVLVPEAHLRLADVLRADGRYAEAITHYREVLRLRPRWAVAHGNLAVALLRSGDVDGAIRHNLEALRIDPLFNEARLNLAEIYEHQGQVEQAIRLAEEAVRLEPDSADARAVLERLRTSGRDRP